MIEIPGQDKVPPQARVRSLSRRGQAQLGLGVDGDPALADEALIPPAVGFDNPDFILGRGQLDYAAEARLITTICWTSAI